MCDKNEIRKLLAPIKRSFKDQKEAILTVMSLVGPGVIFNLVQIQNLLFLLDEHAKERNEDTLFNFLTIKYGPFDQGVYDVLEELHDDDFVEILPGQSCNRVVLKSKGFEIAESSKALDVDSKEGVKNLLHWIMNHNFIELVKAIFDAFPDTRSRSKIA